MNNDIIVIADTQIYNGAPLEHLHALSEYIAKHQPKHIVHIGDHWDFPSLSSYASSLDMEGRRLYDDLEGGFEAFKIIMAASDRDNAKRTYKKYHPQKHFIMGNHENRLARFIEKNPVLEGCFDLDRFIIDQGWTVNEFLDPLWIDGICFIHYLPNPQSGRPIGGGVENKLNKTPHSFVHGHQQQYQFGRRQNMQGTPHFGVCAGSFYLHDEGYRGPAGNTEIRGFVHLKGFQNRYDQRDHDAEFISLERLLAQY
jgi:hypothetical protein